jgi:hypothetical protein
MDKEEIFNMISGLDFGDLVNESEHICTGLVFRGFNSMFFSGGKLERREGIRLLKRESCNGCEKCGWMLENLSQDDCSETIIMPTIDDGKVYTVKITNESRDWETGYVDDYDLEVVLLKD